MTTQNIFKALRNIDEKMILDAIHDEKVNKINMNLKKIVTLAACFILLIGLAIPLALHFIPEDEMTVDELYPFDSLVVGEYTEYENGTVTYDSKEGNSITFTITVNNENEYEHSLLINYYIETEENGKYSANHGQATDYHWLKMLVNGKETEYDYCFMRIPGTYQVTVDYSKLIEADGDAVICDFVLPSIAAFEVYRFEYRD